MVPGVESWLRRRLALCLTISNKIGLDLLYRNLVKKGIEVLNAVAFYLNREGVTHLTELKVALRLRSVGLGTLPQRRRVCKDWVASEWDGRWSGCW